MKEKTDALVRSFFVSMYDIQQVGGGYIWYERATLGDEKVSKSRYRRQTSKNFARHVL